MAPADLAPAVGYRFRPTDQELVGYYLRHKLKADDLSIHDTIPEIGVCKYEPWDLLDLAASASATKFDESQCFFFSPRDYKYFNSTRSNRTTSRGFWKVTGRDREIKSKGTDEVIGNKKTLVYYEGRGRHGKITNWVIHEYEDAQLPCDERTHVLCWLRKDNKKKTKGKSHQLVDDERRTINHMLVEYKNQANMCMNSGEHYFNRSSMIQVHSQSNETIDSMIQIPFESNVPIESMIEIPYQSNEVINSIIQIPSQSSEAIDPMIQIPFESNETIDSLIQIPFESNETIDSSIQIPFESNETIDSSIQIPSQSNEAIASIIQIHFESNDVVESMIQLPFQSSQDEYSIIQISSESHDIINPIKQISPQSYEVIDSMIEKSFQPDEALIHTPPSESNSTITVDSMIQTSIKPAIQPDETLTSMIYVVPPEPNSIVETSEPNSIVETSFDAGEFGSSLFDFTSLLQSPRIDEQGLFEIMATSDMLWHEA